MATLTPEVQKILEDLYRLEPAWKQQEPALIKLVAELLAARPDAVLDEAFRRELRDRLLREFPAPAAAQAVRPAWTSMFGRWRRPAYLLGGAVLGVLLVAGVLTFMPRSRSMSSSSLALLAPTKIKLAAGPAITPAAKHAFGSLASSLTTSPEAQRENAAVAPSAPTLGAGSAGSFGASSGETAASPVPVPGPQALGIGGGARGAAGVVSKDMAVASPLPPEQLPPSYRFRYDGDLDLSQTQVDVLKRDKSFDSKALAGVLGRVDMGLMDLGRLQNLDVQNISLVEDKEFGYQVSINFDDGSINIGQNWQKWPQPYACPDQGDCQPVRLKLEDMPADDQLITIADAFVKEVGIATANYGQPAVDDSWRQYYDAAENKADYWFPDQVTVAYPLLVNGKKVYNSDGRIDGLMVGIDVRNRRAANISSLYAQQYVSSAYDAETDAAAVKDAISRGGILPMYADSAAKVIDLTLGAPEQAYYNDWIYTDGRSENVLVPALVFPVTDRPADGSLYLERVVVPLAKEVLEQAQNSGGGVAVPLMKGEIVPPTPAPAPAGAAGGSSGSAASGTEPAQPPDLPQR